ncbi:hypothetical protein UFOVP270_50 [uncultured Caudovirales phage]|uniref:Uncharacterized protein n=1 Tax=uncultured Caudovirales phage TaxID=2100421 RepID=A0A6J5L435_9CAUD|nr:hypothetical protein UFOVP101_7 [uncultured Caudovirales phage]CAB4134376.1 hypothetical protein UFOVP270_50 [uncultured Caudovirales phage]
MEEVNNLDKVKERIDHFMCHIELSISLYKDDIDLDFSELFNVLDNFEKQIREQHLIAGNKFFRDMIERVTFMNKCASDLAYKGIYYKIQNKE